MSWLKLLCLFALVEIFFAWSTQCRLVLRVIRKHTLDFLLQSFSVAFAEQLDTNTDW